MNERTMESFPSISTSRQMNDSHLTTTTTTANNGAVVASSSISFNLLLLFLLHSLQSHIGRHGRAQHIVDTLVVLTGIFFLGNNQEERKKDRHRHRLESDIDILSQIDAW